MFTRSLHPVVAVCGNKIFQCTDPDDTHCLVSFADLFHQCSSSVFCISVLGYVACFDVLDSNPLINIEQADTLMLLKFSTLSRLDLQRLIH